ncbi:unnamed protein product [Urochloa humidicola]
MAPNGEAAVAAAPAPAPAPKPARRQSKPRRISMEGLQRAMSDLALELSRDRKAATAGAAKAPAPAPPQLPAITEHVEDARCECCGMQEECTPEYVRRVRERYCGRWVCGMCAAAVAGEAESRHGGRTEEALAAHMAVCGRFNRVGRANPVLMQTEAMREILRKRSRSNSPREHVPGSVLTRSSSCIPAITKDFN